MAAPEIPDIEALDRYCAEHNFRINPYLPPETVVLNRWGWMVFGSNPKRNGTRNWPCACVVVRAAFCACC